MAFNSRSLGTPLAILFSFTCSLVEAQNNGIPVVQLPPAATTTAPRSFYVDPLIGSMGGDGSRTKPWKTFAEVVAAKLINGQDTKTGVVHAGDVIYLRSGIHGTITIDGYSGNFSNNSPITVQALPGETPILNQLTARNVSKWNFRGLTFAPVAATPSAAIQKWYTLATFTQADDIIFDSNTLYSQADVSQWSPQDWKNAGVFKALAYTGSRCSITNNTIKNVFIGLSASGSDVRIIGNSIDFFATDAINFTSNDTVISQNIITNHYGQMQDGMHNDGIQGWTIGGAVGRNVVIDSNVVVASTGRHAAIPPIPTGVGQDTLQGICIFDGIWTDVVVTNNVVAVPAHHGIGMYGLSNSAIVNNTVLTQSADPKMKAWIGVFAAKGGLTNNVTVRNNIATRFILPPNGVQSDHNIAMFKQNEWSKERSNRIVVDPTKLFVTYKPSVAMFDLHLSENSPAIGAGNVADAPLHDNVGGKRNPAKIDCGAFAY